jgi:hypothetical protein
MAQTGEQKSAGATPPTPEKVRGTSTSGERQASFFSRFFPSPVQRGAAPSQTGRTRGQQSPLGKLMLGWMILLVVIEIVSVGLQYIDIKFFNLALEKDHWFHTNAFLLGGINTYFAINLIAIAGTYYLLVRLKLIPRDPFNTRSTAATQTSQPGKAAPDGLGNERRTRAARRRSASTVATRQATSTRRATTTRARTPAPPPVPTGHDDEYYQVKAAQRQQRRRGAKR